MRYIVMVLVITLLFAATPASTTAQTWTSGNRPVIEEAVKTIAPENPVDKGSTIFGGSVFFSSMSGDIYENSDSDSQTMFGLAPSIGYFVSPCIMIGGEIEYSKRSHGDDFVSLLAIGPTVGYYFNTIPSRAEVKGAMYPYVKSFFLYGKADMDGDDNGVSVATLGGQGGAIFMLSETAGLDISARFSNMSAKGEWAGAESVSVTVFWVGAGITAFIL